MGYRPPRGVRPPQLEGKRTGRPKGSPNLARAWREVQWGYSHRGDNWVPSVPSGGAELWWHFATLYPDQARAFLERHGKLLHEGKGRLLRRDIDDDDDDF